MKTYRLDPSPPPSLPFVEPLQIPTLPIRIFALSWMLMAWIEVVLRVSMEAHACLSVLYVLPYRSGRDGIGLDEPPC